jgi:hypothetical protein
MRNDSHQFAALWLLVLPLVIGCTADLGKLRAPGHRDAALGVDLPTSDLVAADVEAAEPDARVADQVDARPPIEAAVVDSDAAGGSTGGAGGAGGTAGPDGAGGSIAVGGSGSGGTTSSGVDGAPITGDSGSSETVPAEVGSALPDAGAEKGDDVADVTLDLPSESAADSCDAASPDVALDVPWDGRAPDLPPGTRTCPTTILGSLDSGDGVQVGRLSRVAPVSACGLSKRPAPGKDADPTNFHLYDVYHFGNPTNAAVCFNLTLNYPGTQLFLTVYSSFDPTNITQAYLGDVGDVLSSPQGMGITVDPGSTVDVVVSAVAVGTNPAGSYTLGCSVP